MAVRNEPLEIVVRWRKAFDSADAEAVRKRDQKLAVYLYETALARPLYAGKTERGSVSGRLSDHRGDGVLEECAAESPDRQVFIRIGIPAKPRTAQRIAIIEGILIDWLDTKKSPVMNRRHEHAALTRASGYSLVNLGERGHLPYRMTWVPR